MIKKINNFFSYKMETPDLEASFCRQNLPDEKFQTLVILGLAFVAIVGFIAIDFHILKEYLSLKVSIISRCITIVAAIPLLFFAYRAKETRSLYLNNFLIIILIFSHMIIVNSFRPSDQITLVAWDIVSIFVCYAVFPLSLELQIFAAIYLTIGSSIAWFIFKFPLWSSFEIVSIMGAYVYANIFGIFISKRLNISRRNVFRLLIEEKSTSSKLDTANSKLKLLSITDGLTGLENRRSFDGALVSEWKRNQREKQDLSIIMCDVDFFKKFNDTYGHQMGDDCLVSVGGAISESLKRPGDRAFRYGGEEFVILLPNTNSEGALVVAEFIRKAVENKQIPHETSDVKPFVTLTLGVHSIAPQPGLSPIDFVSYSDKALYRAKERGRNITVLFKV